MSVTNPKKVLKTWGYELWLANNLQEDYCGKILHINAGNKFSMHFHGNKHETFYVLKGACLLAVIDTETSAQSTVELREGDCYEIDRLVPHQVETTIDCDIIETSTYHHDSDSYRIWR